MVASNILQSIYDSANYLFSLFTDLAINDISNFTDFLDGKYTFWLITESEHLMSNMQAINVPVPDIVATALQVGFNVFHFFSNAILPYNCPYIIHFVVALVGWAAFTKGAKLVAQLIDLINPVG